MGTDQLVERDGEIAAALSGLDLIVEGGGRVVSVEGPAGIGKSAVLGAIREQAEQRGFRIFSARGSELEVDFPFGVVRQLFEAAMVDPDARAAALADAAAPAGNVLDPDAEYPGGAVSFSVLHGLYWLTNNLAGDEPALLIVDDLHWCDRPSLRFLAYLANRLDATAIGVATGVRSTEPGTDPALIADILGGPRTISIRPAPLSDAAVGEIVAARFERPGDLEFEVACRRATGGNPLLLNQLLSGLSLEGTTPTAGDIGDLAEIGPRVVSRTVLARLGRLPGEATSVARAVAILGDGCELTAVAELSGLDVNDVARVTGALAQAEILHSGAPLGFVHPLVRDVLYQDIPPAERQLQHARAAKLMEAAGASTERVSAQLLAAPPSGEDWAIDRLSQAAAKAIASGAADSAVTYLTRVLAEPLSDERRPGILLQLGMAEAGTGGADAEEHLLAAYRSLEDPTSRGIAAYALARRLLFVGEAQRAAELAAEARRSLPEGEDIAQVVESAELLSIYFGSRVDDAEERFRRFRTLPDDPSGGQSVLSAAASYDWAYRGGGAEECADLASESMELAAQMEFDTGLSWIIANVVLAAADRPEAMEMWDRALARSHKQGGMFGVMSVHLWRGFGYLRHGDLQDAEESLRAGIEQITLLGGATLDYAHGFLAETLLEQGRIDEAGEALNKIPRPLGYGDGALLWRVAEIELMIASGRAEEAVDAARAHAADCGWRTNPAFAPSRTLEALALQALGRTEEAVEVLRPELEAAETWGAAGTIGRVLRVRGEIRQRDGLEDLDRAIELLENSPMKLDLAKALAARGSIIRRGRKPSEAREPLRRAFELAELCGAAGLATHIRSELHATGVRPRTSAMKGPGSLTPSERRVADLAAEGQTNKGIAQSLYVTPKTVEVHLSNTYRKLEISSRNELAAALAEGGD